MVVSTFDYRGVTLDGGALRRQFDEVRDYYIRIPNDDLLKGFRERAGVAAPGVDLGGWYGQGTFHVFGQIVSGLARMYAATGDPGCKAKVDTLLGEWGKCIRADGYFFAGRPNAPHYIYDKMVGGLVDAYLYCGNAHALMYLRKITDWATANLDRTNAYGYGYTEWYTLSENLFRAYLATGDRKYLDFARVWEYKEYWSIYAGKGDILSKMPTNPPYYHAYSHVNTLSGLGAAYRATGNRWYLRALRNAYDYLQANQVWPTGGFGPNENLLTKDQLVETLKTSHSHFETQCGAWAGFKISKYLITATGDARYGDWIERLAINGIGASIPMTADGRVFYYSDYNLDGGSKRSFEIRWSCCTGTRPMAAADFHDIIYFHDRESIYVNLFTPSTVHWSKDGAKIRISQQTDFPESPRIDFAVGPDRPTEFSVKLRVPGWVDRLPSVLVNGNPVPVSANKLHWLTIHRTWHSGDRMTVTLPMRLWSARMGASGSRPAALLYGPVVMAARSPEGSPSGRVDLNHPEKCFVRDQGDPLTFRLQADHSVLLRPFYTFKEGETYYAFLTDEARPGTGDLSHVSLTYTLTWGVSSIHYSQERGATAEYAFDGTGVTWLYGLFDDAGKARVEIDGKEVATVDLYGNGKGIPAGWEHKGLAPGRHTFRITVLGEKSPASSGVYVNVSGLRIYR